MNLTLITCTGDRPEAFQLCRHWMARQHFRFKVGLNTQWLVVDDGVEPIEPDPQQDYIRLDPMPGKNTLIRNLNAAFKKVTGDIVFFIEDDDYYSPNYLYQMAGLFTVPENYQAVGLGHVDYYNVQHSRYTNLKNKTYAPLAFTAIRTEQIPFLQKSYKGIYKTFDMNYWRNLRDEGLFASVTFKTQQPLGVGMKGLPGRKGIGKGHQKSKLIKWKKDTQDKSKARALLGDNFDHYRKFLRLEH